jgi:hypothetical protein
MLYSAYRRFLIVGWVVFIVILGGLLFLVAPGFAVAFVIFMLVFGLIVIPLHLALTRDRLDDHDGRIPMPSMGLGMWGVDVVDDNSPSAGYSPAYDGPNDEVPPPPTAVHCPRCGAVTTRENAKFCDQCGARLL